MKNNVLGFIVYFVAMVLLSEKVGVLLLAIKENGELKTQLKELRESQSEMKGMMASLLEQLGSPVKKS